MKLSANMEELLIDIAESIDGAMYVARTSKWSRTATALQERGLVSMAYADSYLRQYEVKLTAAGKAVTIKLLGQVPD